MRKLIFIVNPKAKNGLSLKTWRKIEHKIAQIPHTVYFTEYAGHGTILAEEVSEAHEEPLVIVAVGGDGTVHEVMNGIIHFPHVKIAFIPAGSGNDFAKGFGIQEKPDKSVESILRLIDSSGTRFDSGFFTGSYGQNGYFVNSIGAGFDAAISKRANASPLKKWLNFLSIGQLIYVFYLLVELFRYKPGALEIKVDGQKLLFDKTWFVTASNQPFYGGGMQIAPDANPTDGLLNIVIIHHLSKLKLLLVFISVFWGGHLKFKEVSVIKGKEISIYFNQPVPVHADGESIGETPLHIQICPKNWSVIQ